VTSEAEATRLLSQTVQYAFFLRVDRGDSITLTSGTTKTKAKVVTVNQMQIFEPELYFAWFYEGGQWTTYLGGVLMVLVLLAGVMFPLWPPKFRLGVSYLSMGVLGLVGLFFVIAILRLIFWLITIVVAPPGIWIFPQLFADVGFVSVPMSAEACSNRVSVLSRSTRSSRFGTGTSKSRKRARNQRSLAAKKVRDQKHRTICCGRPKRLPLHPIQKSQDLPQHGVAQESKR